MLHGIGQSWRRQRVEATQCEMMMLLLLMLLLLCCLKVLLVLLLLQQLLLQCRIEVLHAVLIVVAGRGSHCCCTQCIHGLLLLLLLLMVLLEVLLQLGAGQGVGRRQRRLTRTAGAAVAVAVVMLLMVMRNRFLLYVCCEHAAIPGIVLLIVGRRGARLPVLHGAAATQKEREREEKVVMSLVCFAPASSFFMLSVFPFFLLFCFFFALLLFLFLPPLTVAQRHPPGQGRMVVAAL